MPSQYEHGPDFQSPNEAEIARLDDELSAAKAEIERLRKALVSITEMGGRGDIGVAKNVARDALCPETHDAAIRAALTS